MGNKQLVARTERIALVRLVKLERDPKSWTATGVFEPIDVLKGKFPKQIRLRYNSQPHSIPKYAFSDFDRHRDKGFWKSKEKFSFLKSRSLGVFTDCQIGFHFVKGQTYLGFFEADRPNHQKAFELIHHPDDLWLAKVRTLVSANSRK